ncbi:MAG: hypothetical protein ACJAZC_001089 [Cryomorphaceae bacterium]|jgi:hypothetical protein
MILKSALLLDWLPVSRFVLETGRFHIIPIIGAGAIGVTVLINHNSETFVDDFLSDKNANNLTKGGENVHSGLKL